MKPFAPFINNTPKYVVSHTLMRLDWHHSSLLSGALRDDIATLRAANVWKVKVGDVTWRQHMLTEPKERVREASQGEEAAIMAQLDRGYDDAIRLALLTGCRRKEIVTLEWTSVDFFGPQFAVIGKGGKRRTISDERPDLCLTLVIARSARGLRLHVRCNKDAPGMTAGAWPAIPDPARPPLARHAAGRRRR